MNMKRARIALLEARMSQEIADMIRRYDGEPHCAPAVRESSLGSETQVASFIDHLTKSATQLVIFFTGVGVNSLLQVAEKLGRSDELLTALRNTTVVSRGPKPNAALKRLQIPVAASAAEPYTTKELLEALQPFVQTDINAAVVHYGERNAFLVEQLEAKGAHVEELMLYEWLLPVDTTPLRQLVTDVIEQRIDAVVFTSQIQARHLFLVAENLVSAKDLAYALNTYTVVASIGPTCTAVLQELGVTPHVEPQHPKIGHLLKALADYNG